MTEDRTSGKSYSWPLRELFLWEEDRWNKQVALLPFRHKFLCHTSLSQSNEVYRPLLKVMFLNT